MRNPCAGRSAGISTLLAHWPNPSLANLDCPCILHVKSTESSSEPDHFIVCFGSQGENVVLADYPGLPVIVPKERLNRFWSGALLYVAKPGDARIEQVERLVSQGASRQPGLVFLAGVAALSLLWIVKQRLNRCAA